MVDFEEKAGLQHDEGELDEDEDGVEQEVVASVVARREEGLQLQHQVHDVRDREDCMQ